MSRCMGNESNDVGAMGSIPRGTHANESTKNAETKPQRNEQELVIKNSYSALGGMLIGESSPISGVSV